MRNADVCVIGAGGVVGSAIVRHLSLAGMRVVALEKHAKPAQETSGANSGVIHSGFHETAGTLKAELAGEGSAMVTSYAERHGVPLLRCGMLIAIPANILTAGLWGEAGALWHLWRGGRRHNVAFHWIFTPSGIRRIAPIEASAGIFIPSVGVIDVPALIAAFQQESIDSGAEIHYDSAVQGIRVEDDAYVVSTKARQFTASAFINSAGLSATEVSRMAGGPSYPLELIRGEYYALAGGMEKWGVRTLVYPAMPARSRSKGIHFGPRPDGRLFLGPSDGIAPKEVFLQAARKFLPQVGEDDLIWSHAGTRPKYLQPDGVSDFLIRVERHRPPLINLIGIDSPGLSSCMAIARHVASLLAADYAD